MGTVTEISRGFLYQNCLNVCQSTFSLTSIYSRHSEVLSPGKNKQSSVVAISPKYAVRTQKNGQFNFC